MFAYYLCFSLSVVQISPCDVLKMVCCICVLLALSDHEVVNVIAEALYSAGCLDWMLQEIVFKDKQRDKVGRDK